MKIKRIKTGRVFETTRYEWENIVVANGNASLYEIIEDDAPFEVKNLKIEMAKRKQNEIKTENNKNGN